MMKLPFLRAVALLVVAFTAQAALSSPRLASSPVNCLGGATVGGGDHFRGAPIEPSDIHENSAGNRLVLQLWLNSQRRLYAEIQRIQRPNPSQVWLAQMHRLLFENGRNAEDILDRLVVNFKDHGPCRNWYGDPADGSVPLGETQEICISSARLAKKLDANNLRGEVSALIMHEVSHILGADEGMAQAIQGKVAEFATKLSFKDKLVAVVRLQDSFKFLNRELDRVDVDAPIISCQQFEPLKNYYFLIDQALSIERQHFLSERAYGAWLEVGSFLKKVNQKPEGCVPAEWLKLAKARVNQVKEELKFLGIGEFFIKVNGQILKPSANKGDSSAEPGRMCFRGTRAQKTCADTCTSQNKTPPADCAKTCDAIQFDCGIFPQDHWEF